MTGLAYSRFPQPTPSGEALTKCEVINGHCKYIWLPNRSQQVTHSCGPNLRSHTVAFNPLTIGAWNICTLTDINDTEHSVRTGIICLKLATVNIVFVLSQRSEKSDPPI